MKIKKFILGPLNNNSILIACSKTGKAALFDPVIGSFQPVFSYCLKEQFHLESVYLTHSHWDHIAEASLFQKKGVLVFVHPDDAGNVENPGSDQLPLLVSIPPLKPDGFVVDEMIFYIGEIAVRVLHTPGHTPGSVCYYFEKEKLLLSGDTLFASTYGNISFPHSDPRKMLASLQKLAHLPQDTRVIPGHGKETVLKNEDWIQEADKYIK
ncbi:MAG: MBL fold metallo-hydrolase [Parachlamydiales bacterium]|nr:MBL fold metallo-hydrolase [Parachlamydiales bacterium]